MEIAPLEPIPQALLLGLVVFFIYQVITSIVTWYRLRQFPGPPLASFSHLWLARTALSGAAWKRHMAVREKYSRGPNPLIRVGPNVLIHDSPDIHRHINAVRSRYDKASWYAAMRLDPYTHTMFSTKDNAFHDDVKARTAAGYSGREVPSLEADINGQVENVKALLRRKYLSTASTTKPVDFAAIANYFTLDSLTKIGFGNEFGYLATDSDMNGYIKLMEDTGFLLALCADVPWIGRLLTSDFLLKNFGPKPTDPSGMGMMMGVAKKVVASRFESDAKDQQDMLGSFVRHGLSQRQCEAEVLMQIAAGSDTTATMIRVTILLLSTAPHAYRCLQDEIDLAVANGAISSPATYSETRALPYLQAVIYESMRYHPPAFSLLPKVVPAKGDTLPGGWFVPGGTLLATSNLGMMRHVPTFGEDVDVFRPERFMQASAGRRLEMERTTELIFGIGRFMCAGKTVAFMELNKIFVELLRDFDFQIINPKSPWTESQHHIFMIRNMWMRVTSRKQEPVGTES